MTTSRDVAKAANVSQSTVSRAFREDVYIDPETKQKILKIAKELGYYPNYTARSLKQQKSGIIGLMLTDPNNAFFASLTKSIEEFVSQRGYRLLLTYNNENPQKERECLQTLLSSRVEGLLAIPVSTQNADLFATLKNQGTEIVQLLRKSYDDLKTVAVDDELGAYLATKHLIDCGHRKIIMTEYEFNETCSTKTEGYLRAFRDIGIDARDMVLDLPFNMDYEGLIAGAIAEHAATAIVMTTVPVALATLKSLAMRGLKYPEDISIMAYDDSEWFDLLGISAITHSMQQIGSAMVKMLFDPVDEDSTVESTSVYVKPYLYLRKSTSVLQEA